MIKYKWIGDTNPDILSGIGFFSASCCGVKFDSFSDFHYICELIDKVQKDSINDGKAEVAAAVARFVGYSK